jgi:hypothetical protein
VSSPEAGAVGGPGSPLLLRHFTRRHPAPRCAGHARRWRCIREARREANGVLGAVLKVLLVPPSLLRPRLVAVVWLLVLDAAEDLLVLLSYAHQLPLPVLLVQALAVGHLVQGAGFRG